MRRLGIGALAMVALCAVSIGCANDGGVQVDSVSSGKTRHELIGVPFGRFLIRVPEGMEPAGATYELRYIQVEDFPWGDGGFDAAWAKRIDAIRKLEAPADVEGERILEVRDLDPPLRKGVLFYDAYVSKIRLWNVLAAFSAHGLWFEVGGEEEFAEAMLQGVGAIARAYRPRSESGLSGGAEGFHMSHGIVSLPFGGTEEVAVRFEDPSSRAILGIEMETVSEVEARSASEKFAETLEGFSDLEESFRKIRTGAREVAGMPGEELVYEVIDGDKHSLEAIWSFPGEEGVAVRPMTTIQISLPGEDTEASLELWDQVLPSLRPNE